MRRPIMVAIGGDSGTGKAAVCAGLRETLGAQQCAIVQLDGYFSLNRAQRNVLGFSPLDPRTHDFAAMTDDLLTLSRAGSVTKPVYDHVMGATAGAETIDARPVVVVQGRFPLLTQSLRSLFDIRVWLERESNLTLPWTVHRDAVERGDGDERVRAAIARRRADYETWLAPQAAYADVRVRFTSAGATFIENGREVAAASLPTTTDPASDLERTIALIERAIAAIADVRLYAVANER